MPSPKQKFYAYVDESGQDTKGLIFVVSVLVIDSERTSLLPRLEAIEKGSGKENLKWRKTRHEFRVAYIEALTELDSLRKSLFVEKFSAGTNYLELTVFATARAILKTVVAPYKVTVFVDGLHGSEVSAFAKALRDLHVQTRKVRGVRKEENDAFIRLVDAICGLVRDAQDGTPWAQEAVERLKTAGFLKEL